MKAKDASNADVG
jgi:hypothetical protein